MDRLKLRRWLGVVLSATILTTLTGLSTSARADSITTTVVAGNGSDGTPVVDGGPATSSSLWGPTDVISTSSGPIIADSIHNELREVDAAGNINAWFGTGNALCDTTDAYRPNGLATGPNGSIFVSTPCGVVFQVAADHTAQIVAGNLSGGFYNPTILPGMVATDAFLSSPAGLDYDSSTDTLYIADQGSSRILKVTGGRIWVVAGTGLNGFNGDGPMLGTMLNYPRDVAVRNGLVYVADSSNGIVRTVDPDGNVVTILSVATPSGLAFDSTGKLYIAGGATGQINTVDAAGSIVTITTLPGGLGGISFDTADNLYVADSGSEYVYKINGLAPPPPTKLIYVALGDSVASGEGINYGWVWNGKKWIRTGPKTPIWEPASDLSLANQDCHRSASGYPYLVAQAMNYTLVDLACTGATANAGVIGNQPFPKQVSELPQLDQAFHGITPDIVSLSVGADDVKFADFVSSCYTIAGSCDNKTNNKKLNSLLAIEQSGLDLILEQLDSKASGAGKRIIVAVTDYYDPFPVLGTKCIDIKGPVVGLVAGEQTWLENGLSRLNANIRNEVAAAHSSYTNLDVRLVELSSQSPALGVMTGHEFCSSDPWAYGPSIDIPSLVFGGSGGGNNPAPFHPTTEGQSGIASRVINALS